MSWARDVWPSERARLMSGHMMPIEREAVTVEELESWFDDELKCESHHTDFRNRECSVAVSHIAKACGPDLLVCDKGAEFIGRFSNDPIPCADCQRPCSDHWRVVPI